jgi:hypothetical protein
LERHRLERQGGRNGTGVALAGLGRMGAESMRRAQQDGTVVWRRSRIVSDGPRAILRVGKCFAGDVGPLSFPIACSGLVCPTSPFGLLYRCRTVRRLSAVSWLPMCKWRVARVAPMA